MVAVAGVALVGRPVLLRSVLQAQMPDSSRVAAQVTTQLALAAVTTDTGDFALWRRDFTRYTDPLWCVAAARHTRDVLRGTLEAQAGFDTLQYMPERDTLPAEVVSVARECGAHFTVAGTAEQALPALFDLALLAGNDTLAHAVVARRAALASTDTARWQVLLWAITNYLDAAPARVAAAEALVTQLDQRESTALLARAHAHTALLEWGQRFGHRALVQREADRVIVLAERMRLQELTWDSLRIRTPGANELFQAWLALFAIARVNAPDSLHLLAQRLRVVYNTPVLQRYLSEVVRGIRPGFSEIVPPAIVSWSDQRVIDWFKPTQAGNDPPGFPHPGDTVPPPHAAYWFPVAGAAPTHLEGHHVVLILNILSLRCLYGSTSLITGWGDASHCDRDAIASLRQILQQYGPAGLTITLVTGVAAGGTSVLGGGLVSPDSGAKAIAWYVQDFLRLPVTVAVDTIPLLRQVPWPDGRHFYSASPLVRQYYPPGSYGVSLFFPDDGRMVMLETAHNGKYVIVDSPGALLGQAFGGPSPPGSTPNSSHDPRAVSTPAMPPVGHP